MSDQIETVREIQDVAQKIERAWIKTDNRVANFPDIVLEKIEGMDLTPLGELSRTIDLLDDPYIGALQYQSTFSDLYLLLYSNSHFYVEMLHWWKSDINIHDHDFSGVQFQLRGKSLNVVYDFDEKERQDGLAQGDIRVRRAEVWEKGGRSVVRPGTQDPHVVIHLGKPTISLLIRTHPQPFYAPQRNYFPPLLASNWGIATSAYRKKLSALRLLRRANPKEYGASLRRNLERGSPSENLFTLEKMQDIVFEGENVHLVKEFANRGEQEASIVKCVAMRRAYLFLANHVKDLPDMSVEDNLAVGTLMAGFDSSNRGSILRQLSHAGYKVNLHATINKAMEGKSGTERSRFDNVLKVLEYRVQ